MPADSRIDLCITGTIFSYYSHKLTSGEESLVKVDMFMELTVNSFRLVYSLFKKEFLKK